MGSRPISDEEFIARVRNNLRLRRLAIAGHPTEVEDTLVHGWPAREIRAIDRVEDALTSALESFTP